MGGVHLEILQVRPSLPIPRPQLKMQSSPPIAIVIFAGPDNTVGYKAYSPNNWCGDCLAEDQYDKFLGRLYNHLAYDAARPVETTTRYGTMKEIHTRYVDTPLVERGNIVHFTTYVHPHCNYRPVHRSSPIFFKDSVVPDAHPGDGYRHNVSSHEFI
jgi:hypothetical protein